MMVLDDELKAQYVHFAARDLFYCARHSGGINTQCHIRFGSDLVPLTNRRKAQG